MSEQLCASIIIPAYNQADYLRRCLEAVAAQTINPASFEIIIVDNNSTDHTQTVGLEFGGMNPGLRFRYVQENQQGASHARNRGIQEASAEIICFLDQDSMPTSGWLNALLCAFDDPQVGCAGGPALPDFQQKQIPPWLQGDLQGMVSSYALPFTQPTQVTRWDQYTRTCSMAVRKKLFDELGTFRVDLDRVPGHLLAAGDTEMADRIHKAGWKVMYIPAASISHLVHADRLEKPYLYEIGRGLAETHIILTSDRHPLHILRWFASDSWYATRMFFRLVIAVLKRKSLWYDDYMRFWMVAIRIPLRVKALVR